MSKLGVEAYYVLHTTSLHSSFENRLPLDDVGQTDSIILRLNSISRPSCEFYEYMDFADITSGYRSSFDDLCANINLKAEPMLQQMFSVLFVQFL